jgi:transposase-like protein
VIAVAVRWYLRYGLSYRDVEELLAERGIEVDHVTIYRWVQTFTAEFIDAARPARHAAGDRWFVDEVRHEALWIRVGVRDLHRRAVAAERLQLGVSLIRETPGRVGAALTTTGQVGTARRPGPG